MKKLCTLLLTLIAINAFAAEATFYTSHKTNILVDASQPSFQVKLASNPTTGYSWYLKQYDPDLITPVKQAYLQPDKKLIGAGGHEVWTFKVKQQGFVVPQQTAVVLVYTRPWENDSSAKLARFVVSTK